MVFFCGTPRLTVPLIRLVFGERLIWLSLLRPPAEPIETKEPQFKTKRPAEAGAFTRYRNDRVEKGRSRRVYLINGIMYGS